MAESATFRTRLVPPGKLGPFLALAGTGALGLAVAATFVGMPLWATVPVLAGAVGWLASRRAIDAEYHVDAAGLRECLTPRTGAPLDRHWTWNTVQSYRLARERTGTLTGRAVLVVRLPEHVIRVREPVDRARRDAHARFVDRFVGYASGDVGAGGTARPPGGPDDPRHESPHRRPLTSGEAPQLRRTLAHHAAVRPSTPEPIPFPNRPSGRLVAGLGAALVVGVALTALLLESRLGVWARFALVPLPVGAWLGWHALYGGND